VSTLRRTRALRAPDLAAYRSWLVDLVRALPPQLAPDTFVLVPTRAAAEQLRRTVRESVDEPIAWPHIGSRGELMELLAGRLPAPPVLVTPMAREAILAAGAREAEEAGAPPPFHARAALVAEMLALYDHIRRAGRSLDDFERLMIGELEPAAASDRGASQLVEQTRFLTAAYRAYETRLVESGQADEHMLRAQLVGNTFARPLRRLVIAVADQPFDTDGYWPADAALVTTIAGLDHIDILSTAAVLDAGYLDRLRLAFVGIEEHDAGSLRLLPLLSVPVEGHAFEYRDREDELEAVVRRLHSESGQDAASPSLERVGLIVARPLPYLYIARTIFGGVGMPFETVDTLPLAAEPYVAAVDVVLECAAANFTRRALMALLKSPHFRFASDGQDLGRAAVSALDKTMAEQRYLGGLDRLQTLAATWTGTERPAAEAALAAASFLAPLRDTRPLLDQVALLRRFLDQHDRDQPLERRRRVRGAVLLTLDGLADAYRQHDPLAVGTVTELSAALRRWLASQTFAAGNPGGGVRILDAQSARFADLDEVQLLGLIDGDWPERQQRNVFYPRSLIAQLEPSRPERITLDADRDSIRHARAMFLDLLGLARDRVRLSTFALESESVVEPSTLLDDVTSAGLSTEVVKAQAATAVFPYERLAADPLSSQSPWAQARAGKTAVDRRRFAGEAGAWVLPRVSVSRLERYMKCPFQFFVANVLQVDEDQEDETSRSPLERGRFLHELFETFFHEWQHRGGGRIAAADMDAARTLFAEIADPALRSLPLAEAGLERARLFGSAVSSGIVDRVFTMEAERAIGIRERLMEYELDDTFTFEGEDGSTRDVRLRAKIDRVDVLADGTFRLIDYKTKYVPDRKLALQLPIYSACVQTSLRRSRGKDIPPSEAMYLSFEGPQAVVALEERGKAFDELSAAAAERLVATLDNIAAGHYPARPETKNLCSMCAFTAVCRQVGGAPEDHG